MDFKKFAGFLAILGFIVALYGCIELYQADANIKKARGYLFTEERAKKERSGPFKIIGIGMLIMLLGLGITISAKNNETKTKNVEEDKNRTQPKEKIKDEKIDTVRETELKKEIHNKLDDDFLKYK